MCALGVAEAQMSALGVEAETRAVRVSGVLVLKTKEGDAQRSGEGRWEKREPCGPCGDRAGWPLNQRRKVGGPNKED